MRWTDPRTDLEMNLEGRDDQGDIEWKNPLQIAQWNNDDRLARFEDKFFGMYFILMFWVCHQFSRIYLDCNFGLM